MNSFMDLNDMRNASFTSILFLFRSRVTYFLSRSGKSTIYALPMFTILLSLRLSIWIKDSIKLIRIFPEFN